MTGQVTTMNMGQAVLYTLGAVILVVGIVLLFVESGLATWIPTGIALAGLLIIVGLLVIGLSDRDKDTEVTHVEHHTRRDH